MTDQEARNKLMDYLYDEMAPDERKRFEQYLQDHPALQDELDELMAIRGLLKKVTADKMTADEDAPGAAGVSGAADASGSSDASVAAESDGGIRNMPGAGLSSGARSSGETKPHGDGRLKHAKGMSGGMKALLASAAVFLLAMMLFAFSKVEFGRTDAGFYLVVGSHPAAERAAGEEALAGLMNRIREENAMLTAAMLDEVREWQLQQIEQIRIEQARQIEQNRIEQAEQIEQIRIQQARQIEQIWDQQNEQLQYVLAQLTSYYDLRRDQDLYLIAEGLAQLEEETNYRLLRTNEALVEVIYALGN